MKRSFSFNLFLLILLNLLIKPIYLFGIEVGIQNSVGSEEYGLYFTMFNFTFLFNVILDMGLNNFQKVKVAADESRGMANMNAILPLKLWLTIIYMVVTVAAAKLMGFEDRYWFFVGWLMLNHALSAFLLLLRANLSGKHLFICDSILSVLDRLIVIIGLGYFLWFGSREFRIEWLAQFQTIAYGIAILVALFMSPGKAHFLKSNFSWSASLHMIRQTMPYAVLILLMSFYNKMDGLMIERFAEDGLKEAGIYAQAYRLLDAGNNFAYLYAGLLLPMFARMLSQQQHYELNHLIDQACRFLIIPASLLCVWCYFNAKSITSFLYHENTAESAICLQWLMGSFVMIAIGYVFGTLLTSSTKLMWLNFTALTTVLINFTLNVFLISKYGAIGASISSFLSLSFMAITQMYLARKQVIIYKFTWIQKLVFANIVTVLAGLVFSHFQFRPIVTLISHASICLTVFALLCFKQDDFREWMSTKASAQ